MADDAIVRSMAAAYGVPLPSADAPACMGCTPSATMASHANLLGSVSTRPYCSNCVRCNGCTPTPVDRRIHYYLDQCKDCQLCARCRKPIPKAFKGYCPCSAPCASCGVAIPPALRGVCPRPDCKKPCFPLLGMTGSTCAQQPCNSRQHCATVNRANAGAV